MSIEQRLLELADETLRDARWKKEIRKIAEEVRIIETRIKRLEDAGDALKAAGYFGGFNGAVNKWIKAKEVKP